MDVKGHVVYILECADLSLYTGYTTDLLRRVKMHNEDKGAKYTRGRGPVKVVFVEKYEAKEVALKREYAIKQLTRKQKIVLIQNQSLLR